MWCMKLNRKVILRPLLPLALAFVWPEASNAVIDCQFSTEGDSIPLDREELEQVPALFPLPDAFCQVFTLWVDWDLGEEAWWPDTTVIAFANLVMPDSMNPATPGTSFAHRTAQFFGVDEDPRYAGIRFVYDWAGSSYDVSRFHIFLNHQGYMMATHDTLWLDIHDPSTTAEEAAKDFFAHEWAHTCYFSTGASGWNDCPSFGEDGLYAPNWDAGTHEFMAKSSEYFNGMVAENWYGNFREQPFTVGIGRDDWYERCQYCSGPYCYPGNHVIGSNRRWAYFPFTAYLQDHFTGDNLLYDWIHQENVCSGANVGPHDLDFLAAQLDRDKYGDDFASGDGDARLAELFREYALSMWVNADHLFAVDDNPEASVHMPLHEGASPRENFGFFKLDYDDPGSPGGNWCPDDALSQPYYVEVGTGTTVVSGPLYGEDFGCAGSEADNFRRELTFDTYAFSILPFYASEAIINSGRCYDLKVEVILDESVTCFTGQSELTWGTSDNDYLHFWVLGYPEHTADLDMHGVEAVLIDEVEYTEFDSSDTFAFTVGCFGTAYKAVCIVASLSEVEASSGVAAAHVIPYHYTCQAQALGENGNTRISSNTTWTAADGPVCLGGLVTVDAGDTLTVEPGVTIWCARQDSSEVDEVGFLVEGQLEMLGTSSAGITLEPIMDQWDGFTVADGGVLLADYLTASGFDHLECAPTAARIELTNSDFTLGPTTTGFDLLAADSVLIADCEVHDAATMRLASHTLQDSKIYQRSGTTWTAVTIDGDATLDDVVIYSARTAIKCEGGSSTLSDVSANSVSVSCMMAPTYGLLAVSDAEVAATNCTFDGFCKAIRLDDTAELRLRDSAVIDATDVGVYVDDRNPIADLGYIMSPPVAGTEGNNCIATADTTDLRVYNRGVNTVLAAKNYWDTASPTSGIFGGKVAWTTYLTSCPSTSGGPGFSVIASPVAAADPLDFGPPVPNPFNPSCDLRFSLPASGAPSTLAIYDLSGRHLITLFSGRADGKEHALRWDGRDDRGLLMSSGVYFARLQVGAESQSRKLVVLK